MAPKPIVHSKMTHQFVVGFGFLTGVWMAIGISPQDLVLKTLQPVLELLPAQIRTLCIIIPTILTILTLIIVFRKGGFFGALAVFIAFAGGLFILTKPSWAGILLVAGFIVGFFAFRKK
jgi:hypothetical protein